jgi:multicomponent Na+:H+ antiporter subunit C
MMSYFSGETVSIVLFFIGFGGLIVRHNMVKSIISVGIMQAAIILYFLAASYIPNSVPPIGVNALPMNLVVADPLPQALMITEIVIGVGVTAAALTLFINLYHRYGTTNWQKAQAKRMERM